MAEDYCGGANWWDRNSGAAGSSAASSTTAYGWLTESTAAVDLNAARSSLDTVPPTSLQLVGLGLSSQAMAEWSQHQQPPLLNNPEKVENSFRSMLQEGMSLNTNFEQDHQYSQQVQWREKMFPTNEDTSSSEFKQIGRGFSLEQPQFSPSESTITCQGLTPTSFQHDSSSSTSVYGSPSSNILQGFLGSTDQQNQTQPTTMNCVGTNINYQQQQQPQHYFSGMAASNVPQFLRASSPKEANHPLQFINNTAPYWNAPPDVSRPNFFATLQTQAPVADAYDEKPKNALEVKETSSTVKKSASESNTKRARSNEGASSTLPPFKVRKEKMGDRITALQQLVSPFGKTDTASVLSEAIEYIKFLHEQVSVLSTPYLKSGSASYQQHQPGNDKTKIDPDAPKQDLRSRGLCLVPVSSTFPVAHETTVDFWTPTFGGTFR